jgi:hypothetical protein
VRPIPCAGHAFPACLLGVALALLAGPAAAVDAPARPVIVPPTAATVLATLRQGHPRLLLSDQRVAELTRLAATDEVVKKGLAEVLADADKLLTAPALERKLIGPRLLMVSRDCLKRTLTLGLAWRLTGREAYLAAGRDNLLAVCTFADWNPSHFLDVAEMANAVGIGYDWFHAGLTAGERERIRAGLITHGLDEGIKAVGGWDGALKPAWWTSSEFNWNQVCHGGLIVGALAVAESDPRYAQVLIPRAVRDMPKALASYDPDGAWPEGPGYWSYATDYTVFALAAMESALGTGFGLGTGPGLAHAGMFPVGCVSPLGLLPNFADVGDRSRFGGSPLLFWLGDHYGQPGLCDSEARLLAAGRHAAPLDLVWYRPAGGGTPAPPLDQRFDGRVQLAVFRSAWDDPDAVYAYIKAGYNAVNHGHLDLGSFEFDCLGERWARDLGSDDYNLPGYFSGGPGGSRWNYYRLNSHSHSVPLIDGRDQLVSGSAAISRFTTGERPAAVVDLTSAYAATSVRRGLALTDQRRAVLIQDEFQLARPAAITWAMTTDAAIACDGASATLTIGGKVLQATLLSPSGAVFTQEPAQPPLPEKQNAGVSRLLVALAPRSGDVRIAVRFAPKDAPAAAVALVPLAEW